MACNGNWTSLVTSAIGESLDAGIGPTLYLPNQICRRHADVWSRPGHSPVHLPTPPWSLVNIMVMNGWLAYFRSMSIGRPISEIRLFQTLTWYFKVKVMGQRQGHAVGPVSYYFASFSFHINQTNTFSDAAISKFDLETSKVKVMSEVNGQGHILYPVSNRYFPFRFTSTGPAISEIWPKSFWPWKITSEIFMKIC